MRLTLDLRFALRSMWRQRGATGALIAVLGLGIGLVSSMFALADPFVLRPLPYPAVDQLVKVGLRSAPNTMNRSMRGLPTIRDWRLRRDLFQSASPSVALDALVRVRQGGRSVPVRTWDITADELQMLGQDPGPCQSTEALPCLLLTTDAFIRQFAGRRELVGETVATATGSAVVAGVLSPSFLFPHGSSIDGLRLVPVEKIDDASAVAGLLARLQPGVTPDTARAALAATVPDGSAWTVTVTSFASTLTESNKAIGWGALVAGLLILLVCVGNVANLLFSRGLSRGAELGTRMALGGSRWDLTRLLGAELVQIAALAILAGLMVTGTTIAGLARTMPLKYMLLGEPAITMRVIVFAAVAGVAVVVLSTSLAWLALRGQAVAGCGGARVHRATTGRSLRFAIVATQSALSMLLVTGTILLGRSYANLFGQDTGLAGNVLALKVSYPPTTASGIGRDLDTALERLRRIPGVESAAASHLGVADGTGVGGPPFVAGGNQVRANPRSITPGFFDASGTLIVEGRPLAAADAGQSNAVVSESFAREAWPGRSALAEVISMGRTPIATVVGVAKDSFDVTLDRKPVPTIYRLLQGFNNWSDELPINVVVRASPSADVSALAARAITEANPDAVILESSSIQERLAKSVAERVFAALVMSLFTVSALAVSVAGLVGVVWFVTARRTRELAIRMAIGARPFHVLYVVSADTLLAAAVGLLVGLVAGRFGSALLERLTYGVDVRTWTNGLAAAGVMLVLVVASVGFAARRAIRLPVIAALRQE